MQQNIPAENKLQTDNENTNSLSVTVFPFWPLYTNQHCTYKHYSQAHCILILTLVGIFGGFAKLYIFGKVIV